jgi:hypothetical protein
MRRQVTLDEPAELLSLIVDAALEDEKPARFCRVISTMPTKLSIVLTDIPGSSRRETRPSLSY